MLRVRYSGTLARVAGRAEELVDLPPSGRLDDLLAELASRHPGVLGGSVEMQWRHGASHVWVAVNGRVLYDEDAFGAQQLTDGDEVTLGAPLGGG
jgi:molybdopterin converting factor small subunit